MAETDEWDMETSAADARDRAGMTALQLLSEALRNDPSRRAVVHRGRTTTAGAFLGEAQALAGRLRAAGLDRGDVLGLSVSDNPLAIRLALAAWMCGASVLALDWRLSERSLRAWRDRMGVRLFAAAEGRPPPGGLDTIPIPRQVAPLDRLSWDPPAEGRLPADHALSSGSTGEPKVRTHSQQALAERIRSLMIEMDRSPPGPMLSALSVAYSASRLAWYRKLASGETVIALDLLHSVRELDAALAQPEVGECSLPPTTIRRLLQLPDGGPGPRYPHLRRLTSVGGPATAADMRGAVTRLTPNYRMMYSAIDCGLITFIEGLDVLRKPGSCGRPPPGVRIGIRDGARDCAVGEVGSIRVIRDGADPVEPGDLGWLDDDGFLYIAGRTSGLMCRNGINVSVAQLEAALLACPEVGDAVVWPVPAADGGDRIHAVLECEAGDEPAVEAFLRRDLSHQDRPDRVVFARRLPRGPAGKPDRLRIAAEFAESSEDEPTDA